MEATLRAAALPHLSGSRQEVLAARRVALEVLLHHLDLRVARTLLGLTRVTTYSLMARPPDPALLRSVTPFTVWDTSHLLVCFNDACPYLVSDWSEMGRQGNRSTSYRFAWHRENGLLLPLPVTSPRALGDGIVY